MIIRFKSCTCAQEGAKVAAPVGDCTVLAMLGSPISTEQPPHEAATFNAVLAMLGTPIRTEQPHHEAATFMTTKLFPEFHRLRQLVLQFMIVQQRNYEADTELKTANQYTW